MRRRRRVPSAVVRLPLVDVAQAASGRCAAWECPRRWPRGRAPAARGRPESGGVEVNVGGAAEVGQGGVGVAVNSSRRCSIQSSPGSDLRVSCCDGTSSRSSPTKNDSESPRRPIPVKRVHIGTDAVPDEDTIKCEVVGKEHIYTEGFGEPRLTAEPSNPRARALRPFPGTLPSTGCPPGSRLAHYRKRQRSIVKATR